ncbi:succinyldiaminopimelate transaminase [Pseudactinotalea sp. Z1739]|uniref:succinyldiaminopimelate transaminase n=1 Tax=Pseudactinotalea sp. Z1739 TaxID=3413028 RepID=UPI003C7AB62E
MGLVQITQDYPWDAVASYAERAGAHPGGLVDLSIGTPVDPTPPVIQRALAEAADAPGYPTVAGTAALREAISSWFDRARGVPGLDPGAVLPTVGSKEMVALLPSLLSIGPGDVVVVPSMAYPTYAIGAQLAGAEVLIADDVAQWTGNPAVRLVWLNSPSNPTGAVLGTELMAEVVTAARHLGAVVASDECYAQLGWDVPWNLEPVPSLLDERVSGGSHEGLLAAYSLSKQSNLAGYRAAFLAGDDALIARLVLMRRHMGMIVPAPVQAAMVAALGDDEHVDSQRELYRARRQALMPALRQAGFAVDHSEAGLYLWVRPQEDSVLTGQDCWALMDSLADLGVLAGPGAFYGAAGTGHVRISLTAPDERVAAAARRLTGS